MGAYTTRSQIGTNTIQAENRRRSAAAPAMIATVMIAKVSWNRMKTLSGRPAFSLSTVRPDRKSRSNPPNSAPSPANAKE